MNDYKELWYELGEWIKMAIKEGYDKGYNTKFDTPENYMFDIYRSVGDKMCELEGIEGGIYKWD